ncbi:hypothetical protein Glove_621g57 [Diversispora epigaea]|uniref:Uncharacterized protein n=1 Tax=Diversispora epigaea TaxID=1348612 RepID=A0A397G620_9GLOM|nr:hypothetical protein Glove_621g57 [Diversispora epigaea]
MRDQDTIGSNLGAGEVCDSVILVISEIAVVYETVQYQKFLHYDSVKDGFDSLTKDFDVVMTELHFTMAVAYYEQRRKDQSFLEKIGGGIIDQNQNINIIVREVACKPIDLQNSDLKESSKIQGHLARSGKLPYIIRFYGLSCTENSGADRGSFRELYLRIALDIRCERMMTTHLVPKISKFKYSRMATSPTTDMKDVTDIVLDGSRKIA